MEAYLLSWGELLLRWLHVIVAIAWIGSSFYFVFLDSSLTPPKDPELQKEGASGELWAVHGGGFYHPVKYNVAPPKLPEHLHWFYWESYTTWLSGFFLFLLSYLWSPTIYLMDPTVMEWAHPTLAISAALSVLVVFWLAYDAICRIFGQGKHGDRTVGILVAILVFAFAYLNTHMFSGRAAFLLTGAMLATSMSANVFFWIIPGQKRVVESIKRGEQPDPIYGKRGKQRSVHNTYFTLPVLFAMLSNHYSFMYGSSNNWLVLIAMMFAGASIRQFFVMRHGYKLGRNSHPWPYALVGVLVLLVLIIWMALPIRASEAQSATASATPQVSTPAATASDASSSTASSSTDSTTPVAALAANYTEVQKVLAQRCYACHGTAVQQKSVRLDSPENVTKHKQMIYQQVVLTKNMPLANATGITESERDLIKHWFESGGAVQ